jgi:hypothetical protein
VLAFGIVGYLDVIEHVRSCVFSGFVCSATDAFTFKQVEEALGHGIIMAIPTTAHGMLNVMGLWER